MKTLLFLLSFALSCIIVSAQKSLIADSSICKPEAIAFCGGGRLVGLELGAYIASRKHVDYSNVKVITCTSAGCLVGLSHLLGFSDEEIERLWIETSCKKMRGRKRLHISLTNVNSYIFTGDGIKEIVEQMLAMKGFDKSITMKQLSEKLSVKIYLMATLVHGKELKEIAFGDSTHADVPVALAARISCSVSNYIKPLRCDSTGANIDTLNISKSPYFLIDGNAFGANNLPILYAIDQVKSRNVLGFYIWGSGKTVENKLLDKIAYNILGKKTDEKVRDILIKSNLWSNVIHLFAEGTASTLKKNITSEDRKKMFQRGREQAEEWFGK